MPTLEAKITRNLREQITKGLLRPGDRLPNREELKRRYDVSMPTLQNAMDRLVAEGFLDVSARKLGTRVHKTPPHLHQYTIIYPGGANLRSGLWRLLHDYAVKLDADSADDRTFSFFYGLDGHMNLAAYEKVVEDVINDRVAGLIFASSANELRQTPLLDHPNIPRTALADENQLPGIPKVCPNRQGFFEQAIAHLGGLGCRSVAIIDSATRVPPEAEPAFADCGMTFNPLWLQCVPPRDHLAANLTRLLMRDPDDRPDAVIVAGEGILEGVRDGCEGLALPIVALANFPLKNELPGVTYIGFSVPDMLRRLVENIDCQRAGKTPPPLTLIPPVLWRHGLTRTDTD